MHYDVLRCSSRPSSVGRYTLISLAAAILIAHATRRLIELPGFLFVKLLQAELPGRGSFLWMANARQALRRNLLAAQIRPGILIGLCWGIASALVTLRATIGSGGAISTSRLRCVYALLFFLHDLLLAVSLRLIRLDVLRGGRIQAKPESGRQQCGK